MKGFLTFVLTFVPKHFLKLKWTTPVIQRAYKKDSSGNYLTDNKGNKIPCTNIGSNWYVRYSFLVEETGKYKEFRVKRGVNRIGDVKEREIAIKGLRNAVEKFLQEGYNPILEKVETNLIDDINKTYSSIDAVELAFRSLNNTWDESTKDVNKVYFNSFKEWLIKNNLSSKEITTIGKKEISFYLDYLSNKKKLANTSRNNHRSFLSSLFTQLAVKDLIDVSFFKYVPKVKAKPKKNRPFSIEMLKNIFSRAKEVEPYLYDFMFFMWHTVLRPIDIVRITINDIDMENRTIAVKTKTEIQSYVRITDPVYIYLNKLDLEKYSKSDFLFSKHFSPGPWNVQKEKSRVDFFGYRFKKKIKAHFNLDEDQGIYAIRHNTALSQREGMLEQGLSEYEMILRLKEIMRHTDTNTTKLYLREIGGALPKDWSKNYNIEI